MVSAAEAEGFAAEGFAGAADFAFAASVKVSYFAGAADFAAGSASSAISSAAEGFAPEGFVPEGSGPRSVSSRLGPLGCHRLVHCRRVEN